MIAMHRIAERVAIDEDFLVLPAVIERAAEQDADSEIDID
jgi:hypothetical protein